VDWRRLRPLGAIGPVIAVASTLAPLSGTVAQAQGASPCAVPDALLEVGEKQRARKGYVVLLRRDPQLPCAMEGLRKINADTTTKEAQALCNRGAAYDRLHRTDDALDSYKSALEKDSSRDSCGEEGIDKLDSPSTLGRWFDAFAAALPQYLLAAGLALAALFILLLFGYSRRVFKCLVRWPILGRILSPRLNLESFTDKSDKHVGEAIEARIRERLTRMREEATRTHEPALDFGTPREDFADLVATHGGLDKALEKASEAAGEQGKAVAALLNLLYTLLPIRRLTIAGVVEPAVGPRASATLNLQRDGRLEAATSLEGPVSETPGTLHASDYLKLAGPAAVWVQYEVARAIRAGGEPGPDAAESYALVLEGLERQGEGRYAEALPLYERALELDRDNWAAWLNRGMAEAFVDGPDRSARSLAAGFNRRMRH
jgi:tetratricopeptide (TPR) repeat protein